jgi:hypothetical protein
VHHMKGRPPLPREQARSETLVVRVKPGARNILRTEAKRLSITESEAVRQALALWLAKQRSNR